MSNKSSKHVAIDLALTTAENITDEIVFKTATTLLDDLIKSVPFSPIVTNLIGAYTNFETAKKQRQLLNFVQHAEDINQGFIEKFFKNKHNAEIGFEILGILDQTYLDPQARMIGRAAILLDSKRISKQDFNKYTYIITKLNSHLIHLIQSLYTTGKDFNSGMKETGHNIISSIGCSLQVSFPNPNMDLISFGFLEEYSDENKKMWNALSQYRRTQFFYDFYEKIFKD